MAASPCRAETSAGSASQHLDIVLNGQSIRVSLPAPDTIHVQWLTEGQAGKTSLVIDPRQQHDTVGKRDADAPSGTNRLDSSRLHVSWNARNHELAIADASGRVLLRTDDLGDLGKGRVAFSHAADESMYGIGGYNATEDASAGLLRDGKQVAEAGEQGHAGAPFVWSTAGYGILLDGLGARFDLSGQRIKASMPPTYPDYYVFVGKPAALFGALAKVSGPSPLFPKWAMGFTNSQWGINEEELLQLVHTYREKHIPIDNFTLDFDWKAWGEDNYGEFRWNPVKFPDGPTGKLGKMMHGLGMQITGIMKPRLHVQTVEGRYATAHHFWVAGEKVSDDYFSHKPVRNIDFDIPAARTWFGDLAVKYGFDKGIAGWWNDEADTTGSDTEFMNMQRALYEAQRRVSNRRVWSINRNFYLGSQRYAYGLWSGDIDTGFASMAGQRARMLSAIDVGAMQWGMDGGGFKGHPSNENYARWIQFGAFTPIFRVHGTFDEKRQPWVYGPIAEKAATAAIRLRYALIPYIYSYENTRRQTGVGLVRPLIFGWPHDKHVRNDVDSWMFGDYLLVSPVVKQGQTGKDIYLPAGRWFDWFSGKPYAGGQTVHVSTDAKRWSDIPLFVLAGAIIPMQPPMDYVGEKPLVEVNVEVFPARQRSSFDYYDDDGSSYAYEHGDWFSQHLSVQRKGTSVQFDLGAPEGSFTPALKFYLLKIHGGAASHVSGDGQRAFDSLGALESSGGEGWATGTDRFGPVTYVKVTSGRARTLTLSWGMTRL